MSLKIFIIAGVILAVGLLMLMQLKMIYKWHPNSKLLVDALERLAMYPQWPGDIRK